MGRLYELTEAIENFEYEIDEETGEVLNDDELMSLMDDRDELIESLCLWRKNLLADAEAYKNEKKSFEEKEKAAKRTADRIFLSIQKALNGEKFHTDKVNVSYRRVSSVEVYDFENVPNEYLRFATPSVDKVLVKDAIKNGKEVQGCRISEELKMNIK